MPKHVLTDAERAERKREAKRKYVEANKEKIREKRREYASRPEVLARKREYYAQKRREAGAPAKPPKLSEEETRAIRKAQEAARRAADPERFRAKNRKYMEKIRREKPEKLLAWRANFVIDAEKREQYNRAAWEKIKQNPERYAAHMAAKRAWEVRNADAILAHKRDWAVKKNLARALGCLIEEIPPKLIDAKFAVINVKRKVKELNK